MNEVSIYKQQWEHHVTWRLVLHDEAEIKGFLDVSRYKKWIEIRSLHVQEGWRRKGLAEALVLKAVELIHSVNFDKKPVWLSFHENNAWLEGFYEKHGFELQEGDGDNPEYMWMKMKTF